MYYKLLQLWGALKSFWNWRLVRGVAELQILTKATYFMLIFVPVLAGTWPAVRLYVNSHNDAVIEATEVLEASSAEYNEVMKSLEVYAVHKLGDLSKDKLEQLNRTIEGIGSTSDKFSEDVKSFTNDFLPKTIEEPSLPWTWAAAFFASLIAVIAHLLYQLSAPEVLRRFTLDDFVKDKKEDFSKHPTEDALIRARDYISTKEGRLERAVADSRIQKLYGEMLILHRNLGSKKNSISPKSFAEDLNVSDLSSLIEILEATEEELNVNDEEILSILRRAYAIKAGSTNIDEQKKMAIVERGAAAEYLYWASKNFFGATLTTLLYGLSVYIIFEIIWHQASHIINMAGWSGLIDLFSIPKKP